MNTVAKVAVTAIVVVALPLALLVTSGWQLESESVRQVMRAGEVTFAAVSCVAMAALLYELWR